MVAIWFFTVHIIRGVIGFLLAMKKLPHTHDLINKMQFKEANNIDFPELAKHMSIAGESSLKEIMNSSKLLLLLYFVLTAVCLILDVVAFFFGVGFFANHTEGTSTTAFPATAMVCLSSVFLCCDLYYIIWVIATKSKFPDWMSKFVFMGLLG
jgi:hypothetical protein